MTHVRELVRRRLEIAWLRVTHLGLLFLIGWLRFMVVWRMTLLAALMWLCGESPRDIRAELASLHDAAVRRAKWRNQS